MNLIDKKDTHSTQTWVCESLSSNNCQVGKYYWLTESFSTPLFYKSIPSAGRGSHRLANSKIPEVQKATLSRGTCNPFIQSDMFIFWILCVTYTVLVCFLSFSVSAQTSLFILFKQSETLRFSYVGPEKDLAHPYSWCTTMAGLKSANTSPLASIRGHGSFKIQGMWGPIECQSSALTVIRHLFRKPELFVQEPNDWNAPGHQHWGQSWSKAEVMSDVMYMTVLTLTHCKNAKSTYRSVACTCILWSHLFLSGLGMCFYSKPFKAKL